VTLLSSGGQFNPQWMINANEALLEERERGPQRCKMCHTNPAEFSGYCGDCYSKLESNKETEKVAKHKFWLFSFFHLFDT
jgi:hypothetical protein